MSDNNETKPAFKRDHDRYFVIKRKDLSNEQLCELRLFIDRYDLPTRECVVVEEDWPEYETVWQMIEARMMQQALAEEAGVRDAFNAWYEGLLPTQVSDDLNREDAWFVWQAARASEATWRTGEPPVAEGKAEEFILAVRRKNSGNRVFVFSATYANQFTDDGCLSGRDGDECIANGWHLVGLDTSGEFDQVYEAVALSEGDEILGWQPLPKWIDEDGVRASEAAAGEPIGEVYEHQDGSFRVGILYYKAAPPFGTKLYTAPQPASEQQAALSLGCGDPKWQERNKAHQATLSLTEEQYQELLEEEYPAIEEQQAAHGLSDEQIIREFYIHTVMDDEPLFTFDRKSALELARAILAAKGDGHE